MRDDWDKGLLVDFVDKIVGGGTPSRKIPEYWNGGIQWATVKDFTEGKDKLKVTEEYISELGLRYSSANIVPSGIPILCTRMAVGRCATSDDSIAINQDLKAIFPNARLESCYLSILLQFLRSEFEGKAIGSTVKGISIGDIKSTKVDVPKKKKQQKIAKILSTCDDVIEKTEATIAKYQSIKQGMMHNLFTRGIDLKTGKLRPKQEDAPELYKESELGWIPKEWEVREFSVYMKNLLNGGTPSTKRKEYWQGTIPWISGADFSDTFQIEKIRRKITIEAVNNSATNIIKQGDILLVTRTGVGKLAIAPFDICISQDITGLVVNSEKAYTRYLFYYLQILVDNFKKLNQGTSINGITRNDLLNRLVIIPIKNEQKQTSRILTQIDKKIKTEQSTLAKYQQLKSGLMQDLLTGKVEVVVDTVQEEVA